jgi:hypothetical protein
MLTNELDALTSRSAGIEAAHAALAASLDALVHEQRALESAVASASARSEDADVKLRRIAAAAREVSDDSAPVPQSPKATLSATRLSPHRDTATRATRYDNEDERRVQRFEQLKARLK